VTDTSSAHGRFGDERLGAVLAEAAHLTPDEIASRVDEALLAFEAGPQRDDVALLVLQATPGDADAAKRPEVAATSHPGV
jgi:serine phosphatase RsbU (regulator of sigma subunit)